jgi:hypothetical protein
MEMNATTVIAQPVNIVFDYVIDLENDANWRTGVDESGWASGDINAPGAVGYTHAGKIKVEWLVISYVQGESVDWEFISGPYEGRGGYRFVPVNGGTQFTLVADIKPSGFLRLLGPIFEWFGRRLNQKDVERLRHILETTQERKGLY